MSLALTASVDTIRPPPAGPVVPWHYQSAADRLIDRITSADRSLVAMIRGITIPVIARARRKPQAPIRKEGIPDLARQWRTRLDTASRLGLVIDRDPDKRGILVSDCRVTGQEFSLADWPDGYYEPGLSVVLIRFRLAPHDIGLTTERLAFISRHAIGRRFQRGAGKSEADVLADLQRLVIQHADLVTQDPFGCRVPSGVWAGEPTGLTGRPERVLAVKTFLGPRELHKRWRP